MEKQKHNIEQIEVFFKSDVDNSTKKDISDFIEDSFSTFINEVGINYEEKVWIIYDVLSAFTRFIKDDYILTYSTNVSYKLKGKQQ